MMSTTNVMSSTGWVRRNAKPSPTPAHGGAEPQRPDRRPGGSGGSPRSSSIATRKPDRVDGVGQEQVAQRRSARPASSGPTMTPACRTVIDSALAAATPSGRRAPG